MTQQMIALVVGGIVSILVEIVPGFKEIWSEWKWRRTSLFGLFVVVPLGAWLLVCTAGVVIPGEYICAIQGVVDAVITGIVAFAGSQAMYLAVTRQSANARLRHPYR